MLDTSQVQVQLFSVTSSNRVEETDALDETTVTGVTAVSNYTRQEVILARQSELGC